MQCKESSNNSLPFILFIMKQSQLSIEVERWKSFYMQKGISESKYSFYLEYITPLLEKDMPVIFDFEHLCRLLGLKPQFISSIINHPESFYRNFSIPKRSGGTRQILAPYYSLKYVQNWIYLNILSRIPISGCAHGFVPKRSIVTNAQYHLSNAYLLKLDLKDFFPSIPINYVIKVFQSQGYTYKVSTYLASICCHEEHLPQGAPTSPTLSNIIARHMDNRLKGLAKHTHTKYTRYADDLAFSGAHIGIGMVSYIKKIVEECGFKLNEKKIRLYNNKGSKILTGINLSNGTLTLPRNYRRNLEQEIFYIRKYGFNSHVSHEKIRNPHYLETILGKINFWLMIEPNNSFAQNAYQHFKQLYQQKKNG